MAELFLAFSDADKVQSATRRLVNFAEITQSIWVGRSDYERRAFKVSEKFSIKILEELLMPRKRYTFS